MKITGLFLAQICHHSDQRNESKLKKLLIPVIGNLICRYFKDCKNIQECLFQLYAECWFANQMVVCYKKYAFLLIKPSKQSVSLYIFFLKI